MTMLALSLATGIVIDDAIVVLENIFRYIEEKGATPKEAAIEGDRGNRPGGHGDDAVAGRHLRAGGVHDRPGRPLLLQFRHHLRDGDHAVDVRVVHADAGAVRVVAAAAGRAARTTRKTKDRGFYAWMDRKYGAMLEWSLRAPAADARHRRRRRGRPPSSSIPTSARSWCRTTTRASSASTCGCRRGTSFDRTLEYMTPIEGELRKALGTNLAAMMTSIQNGSGNYSVQLTPIEERKQSQQELMQVARRTLEQVQERPHQRVGRHRHLRRLERRRRPRRRRRWRRQQPPEHDRAGARHRTAAEATPTTLLEKVKEIDGVTDADTSFEATQPELRIDIDRQRAADLGVSIDTLSSTMRTLIGGEEVSKFKDGDEQFSVRLRLDEPFRNNPATMGDIFVPASGGRMVRVSDVAHLTMATRRARSTATTGCGRSRSTRTSIALKITLGDAIAEARGKVGELGLKAGYQVTFGGSARTLSQAGNDFVARHHPVGAVHLHGARVAVQQLHPPADDHDGAAAQPAGGPAGAHGVRDDDQRLQRDRPDDAVRHRQEELDPAGGLHQHAARGGLDRHQAIVQANHVRLRPILMTTIAIVAGMLPIAFGRGAGSGSRASMAVTIIGGQILCLLLTLLITPVVYSYFDGLRAWRPSDMLNPFRS